eukprot:TRINITY_DN964_c0_g1_i1.p1 TRINITY_DN964_c0_g1~~TRINITY_DN964_c0_g1_i1.p1  ORF type:complete len:243 (-),score=37.25 TRINITY_DN964_c0_g1_i1:51-779(-)
MQLLFTFVICLGLIGSSLLADPCDVNGCTYETAVAGTDIAFNSSGYFPACVRVSAGNSVTFTGPFATYSITGGYIDAENTEVLSANDISAVATGSLHSFEMSTEGVSAFFSPNNTVLRGAIYVGTSCAAAPVAPPMTPVAPPTTPPMSPPMAQQPVAGPTAASNPVAQPQASTPVDSTPVDTSAPSAATPIVSSPTSDTPIASAPTAAPTTSAPRPLRIRVSSGAQIAASVAMLAVVGAAML